MLGLALAHAAGCQRRPQRAQPNVLLITIDTLRADRIGAYGYPLATSPAIDALAKRGVRFADTTVPWPKTWPSLASMVTGQYPITNGVLLRPRRPLPEESTTLAEALHGAGYATGAVVANVNVGRDFGFAQGFDQFVESWAEEAIRQTGKAAFQNAPGRVKRFTDGGRVTDQGIAMLDALGQGKDKPFFLWLHYIDPHGPYVPPAAYAGMFAGSHPAQPVPLDELPPYQVQIDPATGQPSNDLSFYETQYDREVRAVDDQVGRMLAALDARGLTQETLIVLSADHGESLTENHYYLEHGNVPYQTIAAVPMIFALDGKIPAGRVVQHPVGLIDLFATILALTGTPAPPGMQSTSLASLLSATDAEVPRYVFMESGNVEPFQLVARKGPWKLVWLRAAADREWLGRAELELYDLQHDPTEQHDVRAEHSEIATELKAAIETWQRTTPRFRGGAGTDLKQLDPAKQEMLRALGYVE